MTVVKLRWRKLKSGVRSYYLDYHINGVRKREFLKLHLKYHDDRDREELLKLAKEIQRTRTHELTAKDLDIESAIDGEKSFILHFKKYIKEYQGSDVRKLEACLKHLETFLKDSGLTDIKKKQITSETIQKEFKNYLSSRVGHETQKSYLGALRKVIRGEQFSARVVPEETLAKQILTDEEIIHLASVECGNDQVKRAFLLACYTGFGVAECRELEWKHVFNGKINMRRRKTGIELSIPVSEQTLSLLGNRDKEGKVFNLPSTNGVNKTLKNWIKRAKIKKDITFYCGRHSFAVRLLNQDTDLITLSHLMGHKGTSKLRKYLSHVDNKKMKAIDKLPDLDGNG